MTRTERLDGVDWADGTVEKKSGRKLKRTLFGACLVHLTVFDLSLGFPF